MISINGNNVLIGRVGFLESLLFIIHTVKGTNDPDA
ncbi:hypothetical protein CGLO_13678 [Colletotrichum gloeosporioides Cg-14]|uniref:Uncharacterized protein n=1 Tax=Colletotrichum gloeosporioides (strain Cg-14) TaxID=1237896 RepID=T0K356_COLGC|nr:hypothetical protein CGLO_13678 [Colletotrichum gloeosporioides Cg-14]